MAQSLKELYLGLKSSPILTDERFGPKITVLYGFQNIPTTDSVLPLVVVVPKGGQYLPATGYNNQAVPQNRRNISGVKETVELWVWAVGPGLAPLPEDNDNACEEVRDRLCQAMGRQRWSGLYWVPQNEQWQQMTNSTLRYGSGLVITIQAEITVPDVAPVTVRIEAAEIEEIIIVDVE